MPQPMPSPLASSLHRQPSMGAVVADVADAADAVGVAARATAVGATVVGAAEVVVAAATMLNCGACAAVSSATGCARAHYHRRGASTAVPTMHLTYALAVLAAQNATRSAVVPFGDLSSRPPPPQPLPRPPKRMLPSCRLRLNRRYFTHIRHLCLHNRRPRHRLHRDSQPPLPPNLLLTPPALATLSLMLTSVPLAATAPQLPFACPLDRRSSLLRH